MLRYIFIGRCAFLALLGACLFAHWFDLTVYARPVVGGPWLCRERESSEESCEESLHGQRT
jgi:hypothetical protein